MRALRLALALFTTAGCIESYSLRDAAVVDAVDVCAAETCVMTCVNPVCASIPAAYEGFDYPPGTTVTGLNDGPGWSGPWTHYPQGDPMQVRAGGYTYPGLPTTGQRMGWVSGSLGQQERVLPRQACGSVYIQLISRFESAQGGTPQVRLSDSAAVNACGSHGNAAIGANVGDETVCILGVTPATDCNITHNPDTSSCTRAPLSATNLVVVRIDYGCSAGTRMWINPDLSTFSYANPPSPDARWDGFAPAFDTVQIFCRENCNVDEFRVFQAPSSQPR
jgi:hypothetical protein